jgi:hypothetical protein
MSNSLQNLIEVTGLAIFVIVILFSFTSLRRPLPPISYTTNNGLVTITTVIDVRLGRMTNHFQYSAK